MKDFSRDRDSLRNNVELVRNEVILREVLGKMTDRIFSLEEASIVLEKKIKSLEGKISSRSKSSIKKSKYKKH